MEAFKEIVYRQLDRAFGLDREQEPPEQEQEPQRKIGPAANPTVTSSSSASDRDEPTGEEGA